MDLISDFDFAINLSFVLILYSVIKIIYVWYYVFDQTQTFCSRLQCAKENYFTYFMV